MPNRPFTLSPLHLVTLSLLLLLTTLPARAAETQTLYLSGKGHDDPIKWDFTCDNGQNANKPSTINVPSNWELQGFGIYTYGTQNLRPWPKVTGHYKRTFTPPADWKNLQTSIVFEGAMTDTAVLINGQSAGPTHQGGYYRFKYDITKLLNFGQENTIEVAVTDESANASINNAERRGDYWNYGGIFRPVYLEAVPTISIERVAIDAKADGSFRADVFVNAGPFNLPIRAQIYDAQNQPVGEEIVYVKGVDQGGSGPFTLTGKITNPKLWNAETPNLYSLEIQLGPKGTDGHTLRQKFGFRTLEVRNGNDGMGLFLNGQRIMLKGCDRHSFWPDSGRCLSEKISRDDINLMKDMNMNAVRCSHYPPDQHFLDACDELGLYVLDELAGWHQAYDTPTGTRLVQEMVTRDVNHPAILFWDNGNEGGWNNALDTEFAKYDPQNRHVLHPQQTLRGIDNSHYPQYNAVVAKSNGNNVFFPTEMLHGLYDGGAGAGLEDYWSVMQNGRASAGGIIWAFLDEDVKRTDKNGILDSHGNQAPDGIVGPYREKEASFYAIKQIWSPIVITDHEFGTNLKIENRFDFTDLQQCRFTWQAQKFADPTDPAAGHRVVFTSSAIANSPIPPHSTGVLTIRFPPTSMPYGPADVSTLVATDPNGRQIASWVFPNNYINHYQKLAEIPSPGKITATETPDTLTASTADLSLTFSKTTGQLTAISRDNKPIPLTGPFFVAQAETPPAARGAPAPQPPATPDSTLASLTQKTDNNDLLITAAYNNGPLKSLAYRLRPNGWLTLNYAYTLAGPHHYFGIAFDIPESNIQSMRYLGDGPNTVYQNRLAGNTLDVWEKKYNNTIVGDPDNLAPGDHFDYPIFKGYYANIHWLQLQTTTVPVTVIIPPTETDTAPPAHPLYVQLLTPATPPANQIGQTAVPFPKTALSFLHAIPAIGSKFTGPATTGPQGQPAVAKGDYQASISLFFGNLPK